MSGKKLSLFLLCGALTTGCSEQPSDTQELIDELTLDYAVAFRANTGQLWTLDQAGERSERRNGSG